MQSALARDAEHRRVAASRRSVETLFAALTAREREVCLLVSRGTLNKQVAFELGITEKTIKVHRAPVVD